MILVASHGFTVALIVGWVLSVLIGYTVGACLDRRRHLHELRAQIAMLRDDVERASDLEGRDPDDANSIEAVWTRVMPPVRVTVFNAIPYLIFPGEQQRLRDYWNHIRDFDVRAFYDRGTDYVVDRILFDMPVRTKKEALLGALDRLESHIG